MEQDGIYPEDSKKFTFGTFIKNNKFSEHDYHIDESGYAFEIKDIESIFLQPLPVRVKDIGEVAERMKCNMLPKEFAKFDPCWMSEYDETII